MKLWLLTRLADTPVYDVTNGMVVRAESEERARKVAAALTISDDGPETWLNPNGSTCDELTAHGAEMVVLRDFNAG